MTLKENLKKACELEQSIYERTGKLRKTEAELPKMQERIKKKKSELQEELEKKRNKLEYVRFKQKRLEGTEPNGLALPIVIFCVALVAVVLFHILTNYLLVDLFAVESGVGIFFSLLIVNIIPTVAVCVAQLLLLDFLFTTKRVWLRALITLAIIQVISFWYLNSRFDQGDTLTFAIFLAMWVFVGIIIIAGTITCLVMYQKQKKTCREDHQVARKLKRELPNMEREILAFKASIEKYNKDSSLALSKLSKDIQKQKNELEMVKRNLTNTYIQADVHPSYRDWVKVATMYEYIDVGRCYELKGPHGAYNLYEQELFARKILDSLGAINCSINSKSDEILDSQRYLRSAVGRSNYLLSQMKVDTYDF